MSTARLHKALKWLQTLEGGRETDTIKEAKAELEAIEKAAKEIAAWRGDGPDWKPAVGAFELIERIAREAK